MMISKIEIECFQINLMFKFVYAFKVGIIKITFKYIYIHWGLHFLQTFDPKILASSLLFTNFLEFIYFFIFSPTKIGKLKKFEIKIMLVGGGS